MAETRFEWVDNNDLAGANPQSRKAALAGRQLPPLLRGLAATSSQYDPSPQLRDAVNVALTLGMPLLITGEPGTGKTHCAYWLACHFGIPDSHFFKVDTRSTTTHHDLLWRFDAVKYLHAAYVNKDPNKTIEKKDYVEKGPLWEAYLTTELTVLLIDEIDKASRDFPNDLLFVLDQREFEPPEWGEMVRPKASAPPIVVITSNSEKRLPEPFLRRCVFHHIEFNEELVKRAVQAHGHHFPNLPQPVIDAAIARFFDLRAQTLLKPPATAELLVWLAVLAAQGVRDAAKVADQSLAELARGGLLVKHHEDIERLSR